MGKQQVIKSRHGMSAAEGMVHAVLIVCTAGCWYPVYRARKHSVDRTTTTYLPQLQQPVTGDRERFERSVVSDTPRVPIEQRLADRKDASEVRAVEHVEAHLRGDYPFWKLTTRELMLLRKAKAEPKQPV